MVGWPYAHNRADLGLTISDKSRFAPAIVATSSFRGRERTCPFLPGTGERLDRPVLCRRAEEEHEHERGQGQWTAEVVRTRQPRAVDATPRIAHHMRLLSRVCTEWQGGHRVRTFGVWGAGGGCIHPTVDLASLRPLSIDPGPLRPAFDVSHS